MDLGSLSRKLNLNHLSEEECEAVLKVIQRDFSLRQQEKERLGKIEEEIEEEDSKADILAKEQNFNENCCMRCFSRFFFIFNAKVQCLKCKFNVCKNCSQYDKEEKGYVCRVCSKQKDLSTKACDWFYADVQQKFKRFGSAKVVRSLHKRKTESEESDYAMSDSAVFSAPSARIRRGRHSNQLSGVFSMDLDENSMNNLERAAKEREANHNATVDRQSYTCTVAKDRDSYEAVRDAELKQFDAQFTNVIMDVKRVLHDVRAGHPSRTGALVTRHEYEKSVDNHKLHLTSALSNLSQSLHIALDNQEASDRVRNPDLPKTTTAKHELVKATIHKQVEKICRCSLDLDDERTSEYGSDNSSDINTRPFEDLLARAVIRQLINEQFGMSRLEKEEEQDHVTSSTSDLSDSSEVYANKTDKTSPQYSSYDEVSGDELDEIVKRNMKADRSSRTETAGHINNIHSLDGGGGGGGGGVKHKQLSKREAVSASSRGEKTNSRPAEANHLESGRVVNSAERALSVEIERAAESVMESGRVVNSTERALSVEIEPAAKNAVSTRSSEKEARSPAPKGTKKDLSMEERGDSEVKHARPVPSPRVRHSTPVKPEVVAEVSEVQVSPEIVGEKPEASPRPAPRTPKPADETGIDDDVTEEDQLAAFKFAQEHTPSLPSFEFEPESEQSEITVDLSEDVDTDGSILMADGDITFGNRLSSSSGLFQDRNIISAYDNYGQKKVGKDSKQPTLMMVPKGEVEENIVPKVGDQNADELSDLSENEAASDISLEESSSEDEVDLEDVEEEEEEEEEEGEEEDAEDGFFNREGHFVVNDRMKAAHVGSGMKRPYAHSEAQTVSISKVTSRASGQTSQSQAKPVSVQTDLELVTSAQSKQHSAKHAKRNRDDIDVPPPSPEIPDVDPRFVVKPEKVVTVMEGECAKFQVELEGTQPIDVFWYKDTIGVYDLADDDRCDITQSDTCRFTCQMYGVTRQDQGQYLCIAINERGQCSRAFKVKVTEYEGEQAPAEFMKTLQDIETRVGESAKLRCKVKGSPQPRLAWYKDGKPITNNDHFRIEKFGKRDYMLSIDYVTMADDAQFTVVATNAAGQVRCSAQVMVDPQARDEAESNSGVKGGKHNPLLTSPDCYPDTDALLRLAEQVQNQNVETQRATEDMIHSASRLSTIQRDLDEATSSLDRSEKELVTMDTNNNKGRHNEDGDLKTDAAKVRKATESALRILSTLETDSSFNSAQPQDRTETEIELNFTYEQYDLLYRAGLISHDQIRKGTVKAKHYEKIKEFFEDEQRMEEAIARKISEEEGAHDVIVTPEFPTVLDCGLKRVDSKRYGKDYVVNRGTPQLKRRVWRVRTSSMDGGEVVQATPAGEREIVNTEQTKEDVQRLSCGALSAYILHMPDTWRRYDDAVRELQRRAVNTLEEDVYIAAGKAFHLEDQLRGLEEKIERLDEASATEELGRLQEEMLQVSVQVHQSDKQVCGIETRLEETKANPEQKSRDTKPNVSSISASNVAMPLDNAHEHLLRTEAGLSHNSSTSLTSPSRDEQYPITGQRTKRVESASVLRSQSESASIPRSQSESASVLRSQSESASILRSQSECGVLESTEEHEIETESKPDEDVRLPSVQNLRTMFCHDDTSAQEAGVKRVYSLTGRDIPRSVRVKLKLNQREAASHPHVTTIFQPHTDSNSKPDTLHSSPECEKLSPLSPRSVGSPEPNSPAVAMATPSPGNHIVRRGSGVEGGDSKSQRRSRSDSERSDTSGASVASASGASSARREKSSAILARAAFWDRRILSGESDDAKVNIQAFPDFPEETLQRGQPKD